MRSDVTFTSEGLKCAGWLYAPDALEAGQRRPAVVTARGFSAVKEMHLANRAQKFEEAGLVALVFDYRYFGESEGEPRGRLFPAEQHEDYRNAITWVSRRPEVDPDRIGVWGSSYSGGHVLHLAAFDRRIKAAVSQVPLPDGWENARRLMRPDVFAAFHGMLADDRLRRYEGGESVHIPVVAPEGEPSALPTTAPPTGETRSPWGRWRSSSSTTRRRTSTASRPPRC